mgnify:CR=1 FL=1
MCIAIFNFLLYFLSLKSFKTKTMRKLFTGLCSLSLLLSGCNTGTKNETTVSDTSATNAAATNNSKETKEERNKKVEMESIKAVQTKMP